MKISFPHPHVRDIQFTQFGLLILAGCLIASDLSLICKAGLTNLLATSLIFLLAIFYQLAKKAEPLNLESDVYSQILGGLIIVLLAIGIPFLSDYDFLIRLFTFISALSLALVASGINKLKQYWQELLLLLILAVPLERLIQPVNEVFGVATTLAKISTFILWYIGFEVSRQGETIILPIKAIWVSPNCAGTLTMLWMLQLAILFLFIFPTNFIQKILVPVVAVLIVILGNGIRIAIMAVLAAYNYGAFEYWHSDKFQFFSTIFILLFGLFCRALIRRQ